MDYSGEQPLGFYSVVCGLDFTNIAQSKLLGENVFLPTENYTNYSYRTAEEENGWL
jgi:hypothetical protein